MKKTGASGLRGVARQLTADGFLDLLPGAAIVGGEGVDRLSGVEPLRDAEGGDAGAGQHRPPEGDARVDDHDARAGREVRRVWSRTPAERVEPDGQAVHVAVDALEQRAQDLRHGELAALRHVD